jgi:hypothetical protein
MMVDFFIARSVWRKAADGLVRVDALRAPPPS